MGKNLESVVSHNLHPSDYSMIQKNWKKKKKNKQTNKQWHSTYELRR